MDKQIKNVYKLAKREIKEAKKIAIFSHISPDIDCLASSYGLRLALLSLGKEVDLFNKETFTLDQRLLLDEKLMKKGDVNPEKYDLFIALDTPTIDRLGEYKDVFDAFPNTIKIDHHRNSAPYALINIVDATASATCQMLYDFIRYLGVKITPEIADMLFAGLSTDTSSFMNGNTSLLSFETATKLFRLGAHVHKINEALYYNTARSTLAIKKVFLEKMQIIDDQIAICYISLDDLKKAGATKSDCDGFSRELSLIEGVNMACQITQKTKDTFNMSFRSKEGYDVNLIASIFGGGGHLCASGAVCKAKTAESLIDALIKEFRDYLKKRDKNA